MRWPLLLSILSIQTFLFGAAKEQNGPPPPQTQESPRILPRGYFDESYPLLELKAGYFFFTTSKMRNVYSSGGFALALSGSFPVYQCLQLYGSVGYLQASGKSKGGHQRTTLWQVPIDIGLKPLFNISSFAQYYIALGPRYFYVHQRNHSSFVNRNLGNTGLGFFVNTGFNFFPMRHLFIDLFAEYAYEPTSFSPSKANVFGSSFQASPATFGLGIGYAF